MKRRIFIVVAFTALFAVVLKIHAAGRRMLYPGRVMPLNEDTLKKPAKWAG
jgi:hypothetical protein